MAFCSKLQPMSRGEADLEVKVAAITEIARILTSPDRVRALLLVFDSPHPLTSNNVWRAGMSPNARFQHLQKIRDFLKVTTGGGQLPSEYGRGEHSDQLEVILSRMAQLHQDQQDAAGQASNDED